MDEQTYRHFATIEPVNARDMGPKMAADEHDAPPLRKRVRKVIFTVDVEKLEDSIGIRRIERVVARKIARDVEDDGISLARDVPV